MCKHEQIQLLLLQRKISNSSGINSRKSKQIVEMNSSINLPDYRAPSHQTIKSCLIIIFNK